MQNNHNIVKHPHIRSAPPHHQEDNQVAPLKWLFFIPTVYQPVNMNISLQHIHYAIKRRNVKIPFDIIGNLKRNFLAFPAYTAPFLSQQGEKAPTKGLKPLTKRLLY